MNKLSQFSGWVVLALFLVFPISRTEAMPPGGLAGDVGELQMKMAEVSQQTNALQTEVATLQTEVATLQNEVVTLMDGLSDIPELHIRSVRNVSPVEILDTQGVSIMGMTITTTEEGPFIFLFSGKIDYFGPTPDKAFLATLIYLDGSIVRSPLPRTRSFEFGEQNEVNWSATTHVLPGEHFVKVSLSCGAPFVSETCPDLGVSIQLRDSQLIVMHPK